MWPDREPNVLGDLANPEGAYLGLFDRLADRRRYRQEWTLLNRTSQLFHSTLDLEQVFANVMKQVRCLLGVSACSVWLIDRATNELVCREASGPEYQSVRDRRRSPGEGIAGWVVCTGEGLIVPDTQVDVRHFRDGQTGLGRCSILCVPMRVNRDVIGVLQAVDKEVNRFNLADLARLESLATSAGIAIRNAERFEALGQRIAMLEAQAKDLDAFAHTVAHNLKGSLCLITGFADLLKEQHATLSAEELKRYAQILAKSGHKMENIVKELLLLARIRKEEVAVEPLSMGSIVHAATCRLSDMVEAYQAQMILPSVWPIPLGYGPWIEEVWVNYISNAIKYGGQPPRVELGAVRENGVARFWVRDNGPGLVSDELDRLFTPFTRLGQTRVNGDGLGLSIVRCIVEKLRGKVGVESEKGRGSVFSFTLPDAEQCALQIVSPVVTEQVVHVY
jgi:signal transduction histidine kinase